MNLHVALVMSVASARVLEVIASRIDALVKAPDVNINVHACPGDYFLQVIPNTQYKIAKAIKGKLILWLCTSRRITRLAYHWMP